ncbi:MAG TPA: protein-methionine-sulfoxide reductase catalytic subunit MsrP [Humisphaera sp.]|jgi:sulfoxide reductase catalytic subunit YedY|nr:protein-methionine-sulfoxide reductase catalytic subunit MsrP [Humisphaera sp.]
MSQSQPPSSQITDERLYRTRRQILRAGILGGSVAATAWAYRKLNPLTSNEAMSTRQIAGVVSATQASVIAPLGPDDPLTPLKTITHYNNFYEFSTDKEEVAELAQTFITRPWQVVIDGQCARPRTFDIDELLKIAPPEERVYRMRCVERWSMVIPWIGLPLARVLDRVEPKPSAKYVAFETVMNRAQMPGQREHILEWPYVEGLRMDEAMHPLTILASGLYGRELPPQDGAPLRLVVPWKYGFKGIKSIVKISLTESQPPTSWNRYAPNEYGFYANVNPAVQHPRWSQALEQRLGDSSDTRATLPFNGYGEQVASLYAGMDLRRDF